ncbi:MULTISPECIES: hypothetical protein [Parabacteroides]|uniref:Uncharacterized protein n=2 Tax=Parabacteroides goldsteinii TaxID=328812 RepID=A0A6G1ZJG2_9BACT|nr:MULTISPECIES: hypothetical protein [Parabacteroides]EOS19243.1 hypothetical protein C803_00962 [Parabacteroides goldsteinii dnLKV18]KAI4361145.1 hypothetical protein C825_003208 [Parabacteroides sp. ASF519]MBF0763765.1 hypothetical protein [Parabacteroides goldsteinii]MDZ3929687.1 hypothetical protein [Parabacteroides goldsteinii]MRX91706.1 hypothetical protein [Parabacteroides goldsteinii]
MDEKGPYIEQLEEGESLYSGLWQQMLDDVQRMSGMVWTDYNVHDPGVTLMDIASYALAETDYKLSFPHQDYLTGENGEFNPEWFGLYRPVEVYTTAPVTTEDYRKLFFSHIPDLENIWLDADRATGGYTIRAVLSPFEGNPETIRQQIETIYQSHRNLCEHLDRIEISQPEELEFHADFEIEPGKDATLMLAEVYWTILRYLSGAVRILTPDDQTAAGISPENWLEGSKDAIRVEIPELQNTEYELYKQLRAADGIRSFSTCYLMKDGEPLSYFTQGFSLKIPKKEEELTACIRCGRSVMRVDVEKFRALLESFYHTKGRNREMKNVQKRYDWGIPQGTYRDIFSHYPLAKDFPACYWFSCNQDGSSSFETYLELYDKVIEDGLEEVKKLPRLLSIINGTELPAKVIYERKSRYLDFLDRLYGVESYPDWMKEYGGYGETKEETLHRRMDFLQNIARLTKNRAGARNITDSDGKENIIVVKEWFCRMMGINRNENRPVGNVLPGHNLILMKTDEKDKRFRDKLTSRLIYEKMSYTENVQVVYPVLLPEDKKEKLEQYSMLRKELPVFNHNFISSGLFRGGICLDNYRIVQAAENEYMLVFHDREEDSWMNLGRTDDKKQLNLLANILRRYLLELNRASETLYIIEPVLSDIKRPFTLQLVLPGWTARFHAPRFRESCRELLRSLLPAHLTGTVYWLDTASMQEFEDCYLLWKKALARQYKDDAEILQSHIDEILEKAEYKQLLDDTN